MIFRRTILGWDGLIAGIVTRDLARANWVADDFVSGNMRVNSLNILLPGTLFGEAKKSGFGEENSPTH